MPTRLELLDTRGWLWGRPRLDPPPPVVDDRPRYAVVFLDRSKRGYARPRPVQLDCEPAVWVKMERDGVGGMTKRTWRREYGDAGTVYREQAPAAFVPTAYKPGGGIKHSKRGSKVEPEPAVFEDEWA